MTKSNPLPKEAAAHTRGHNRPQQQKSRGEMLRKVATVSLLLVCSASLCGAFAPISMGATKLQLGASRGLGLAASRTQSPGHCGAALRMQTQPEERTGGAALAPLTLPAAIAVLAPAIAVAAGGDGDVSTSPENLEQIRSTLDISLAILSTLFFIRIPISWYPQMDLTKFPQAIVCA